VSRDVIGFNRRPPSRHPVSRAPRAPEPAAAPVTVPEPSVALAAAPAPQSAPPKPPRRRTAPKPMPHPEAASTEVRWVRLLPDQAAWLAEMAFLGNQELQDQARQAGRYRLDSRLTESDVIRYAIEEVRARGGGWPEHRRGVLREAGQMRKPGRPSRGATP
jgi:hypothetical protein